MSGAISESELAEIEARVLAASPGPWRASIEGRDHTSGDDFIGCGEGSSRGEDMYVTRDSGPAGAADLDFIANARQDIPRLVAELRRLRSTE